MIPQHHRNQQITASSYCQN